MFIRILFVIVDWICLLIVLKLFKKNYANILSNLASWKGPIWSFDELASYYYFQSINYV